MRPKNIRIGSKAYKTILEQESKFRKSQKSKKKVYGDRLNKSREGLVSALRNLRTGSDVGDSRKYVRSLKVSDIMGGGKALYNRVRAIKEFKRSIDYLERPDIKEALESKKAEDKRFKTPYDIESYNKLRAALQVDPQALNRGYIGDDKSTSQGLMTNLLNFLRYKTSPEEIDDDIRYISSQNQFIRDLYKVSGSKEGLENFRSRFFSVMREAMSKSKMQYNSDDYFAAITSMNNEESFSGNNEVVVDRLLKYMENNMTQVQLLSTSFGTKGVKGWLGRIKTPDPVKVSNREVKAQKKEKEIDYWKGSELLDMSPKKIAELIGINSKDALKLQDRYGNVTFGTVNAIANNFKNVGSDAKNAAIITYLEKVIK